MLEKDGRDKPNHVIELVRPKKEGIPKHLPKILALMAPPASGKEILMLILASYFGRIAIQIALGLAHLPEILIIQKLTTRFSRGDGDIAKKCISDSEMQAMIAAEEALCDYILPANGKTYAYRRKEFAEPRSEHILVIEPNIITAEALKEEFGDRLELIFFVSDRAYRAKLLQLRGSEGPAEVKKRLDLGDGQIIYGLLLAGAPDEQMQQFIHEDIFASYLRLKNILLGDNQKDLEQIKAYFVKTVGEDLTNLIISQLDSPKSSSKAPLLAQFGDVERKPTQQEGNQSFAECVFLNPSFFSPNPKTRGPLKDAAVRLAIKALTNLPLKQIPPMTGKSTYGSDLLHIFKKVFGRDKELVEVENILGTAIPLMTRNHVFDAGPGWKITYLDIVDQIVKNQTSRNLEINCDEDISKDPVEDDFTRESLSIKWNQQQASDGKIMTLTMESERAQNPMTYVDLGYRFTASAFQTNQSPTAEVNFDIRFEGPATVTNYYQISNRQIFMHLFTEILKKLNMENFTYPPHVDIVTPKDEITGTTSLDTVKKEGLLYRRQSTFLENPDGEILFIEDGQGLLMPPINSIVRTGQYSFQAAQLATARDAELNPLQIHPEYYYPHHRTTQGPTAASSFIPKKGMIAAHLHTVFYTYVNWDQAAQQNELWKSNNPVWINHQEVQRMNELETSPFTPLTSAIIRPVNLEDLCLPS
jgi:hypothetical protein